jgi:hypothetical protein
MKKARRMDGIVKAGIMLFVTTIIGMFMISSVGGTSITVDAPTTKVYGNQGFTVTIDCNPTQAIKAFEFRLSFNPLLVKVNSVSEGAIFGNYTTFFNSGTIKNSEGSITDIYGLIIGPGNVSGNGTLITISCTAKDATGTSLLELKDVGITDELGYIPFTVTDGSVQIQSTGGGGGSPPPPSGGGYTPEPNGNQPPETPEKPVGPTFIEQGVNYKYVAIADDPDGDGIRYRFDWGDGNMSNWSAIIEANSSISMNHSWDAITTYSVRVIAQDDDGLNSSWSLPLNVTVSSFEPEEKEPVADFTLPSNLSANTTIVFDGSLSFDEDGVIVSYFWMFGDGTTGVGRNPSHIYVNPGEYIVTLTITDNTGNTCNKSMIVSIGAELQEAQSEGSLEIPPIAIGLLFVGAGGTILTIILIHFRDHISVFFAYRKSHPLLHHSPSHSRRKIQKIDDKIEKMRRKIEQY